jgi:hypothetical protein
MFTKKNVAKTVANVDFDSQLKLNFKFKIFISSNHNISQYYKIFYKFLL